jgi:hypothetical protein
LDGEALYIDPEAGHAEAQRLAVEQGDSVPLSPRTVGKRLQERGHLVSTDQRRKRLTVRISLVRASDRKTADVRVEVWHLDARRFLGAQKPSQTSQTSH